MVVSCQKCRTRFQLDEARIPTKGVRVRCSKCKHAFFVAPPGGKDAAIHDLAEEAAQSGRAAKTRPAPTTDLRPPGESEDDWQFNIEPPAADGPGAATPPPAEITDSEPTERDSAASFFELTGLPDREGEGEPRDAKAEAADKADKKAAKAAKKAKVVPEEIAPELEVDFKNLGNPESWEFGAPIVPNAKAEKTKAKAKGKIAAPARATEEAPAKEVRTTLSRVAPGAFLGGVGGAIGWAGTALLFAFGLQGALAPPAAVTELAPAAIGPLEVTELRVRHLENVFVGQLVVITGELHNPGGQGVQAGAAPLVRITDEAGEPLDLSPVWIGAEILDAELRRGDPTAMAAAQEQASRTLGERVFMANESIAVTALLAELPPLAVGFRIESVPLADLRPPAAAPPPRAEDGDADDALEAIADPSGDSSGDGVK